MLLFVILLLVLVNLAVHETAHAIAMRRYGVEIKEAGLGISVPGLTFRFRLPWLSFPLTFSPVLIGAYVAPTPQGEKDLERLPYRKRAVIFGAGVLGNFAIGAVLLIAAMLFFGTLTEPRVFVRIIVAAAIIILVWRTPGPLCQYAVPLLGTALLGFLLWTLMPSFLDNPSEAALYGGTSPNENPAVVGPVGIAQLASQTKTLVEVFYISTAISFGIALMNMLPLQPLDGGKIVVAMLAKIFGQRVVTPFNVLSFLIIAGLIILIFVGDINRLSL